MMKLFIIRFLGFALFGIMFPFVSVYANNVSTITEIIFTPTANDETTEYAIQVDDLSANTTRYAQKNHRLGRGIIWRTYTKWIGDNKNIQVTNLLPTHNYRIILIARTEGETDENVFTDVDFKIKQRPKKPKGITVVASSQTSLTIGWVQRENAKEYRMQFRASDVLVKKKWQTFRDITGVEKIVDNLTPQTMYALRLRSCNAIGCSSYTAWKYFQTSF